MTEELKKLGAPPSEYLPDGKGYYSTPMIVDSETGEMIVDSWKIAEWLDKKFPEGPTLFPSGTQAAIKLFEDAWQKERYAEEDEGCHCSKAESHR